jgi:hypothetical protein
MNWYKVQIRKMRQAEAGRLVRTAERLRKGLIVRARDNGSIYVRDLMEKAGIEVDWRRFPCLE